MNLVLGVCRWPVTVLLTLNESTQNRVRLRLKPCPQASPSAPATSLFTSVVQLGTQTPQTIHDPELSPPALRFTPQMTGPDNRIARSPVQKRGYTVGLKKCRQRHSKVDSLEEVKGHRAGMLSLRPALLLLENGGLAHISPVLASSL